MTLAREIVKIIMVTIIVKNLPQVFGVSVDTIQFLVLSSLAAAKNTWFTSLIGIYLLMLGYLLIGKCLNFYLITLNLTWSLLGISAAVGFSIATWIV